MVWDDRAAARQWLLTPHPELEWQAAAGCGSSELGARQVEDLLDRIYYGIPS